MKTTLQIDCPSEVLISLHADAEQFGELMKLQTAIYLFKENKISSGTAASWLKVERTTFLQKAMEAGAVLLDDSDDEFRREISLSQQRQNKTTNRDTLNALKVNSFTPLSRDKIYDR